MYRAEFHSMLPFFVSSVRRYLEKYSRIQDLGKHILREGDNENFEKVSSYKKPLRPKQSYFIINSFIRTCTKHRKLNALKQ